MTMEGSNVQVAYLAAGANRQTAVADSSSIDGTVAYGAGRNIALWRPLLSDGIASLAGGHTDTIKAIKFLPPCTADQDTQYLVSGGDDHCLKLWALNRADGTAVCLQSVQAHSRPINCIATIAAPFELAPSRALLASGSADGTIKIWLFNSGRLELDQCVMPTHKLIPLALALSPLNTDRTAFVLAAAGTADAIHIFVLGTSDDLQLSLQANLSGHEGWIRSLDFIREDCSNPHSDILLASASQDKYIRLWRIRRGRGPRLQAAFSPEFTMSAFLPGKSPSNKAHRLTDGELDYSLTFDSLLLGHDDWVYSAQWYIDSSPGTAARLQLLSASADNSIAIWEADPASGIWLTTARLGEVSREKGATTATGSVGGFWTGLWLPSPATGPTVLTLTRTGSWRMWNCDNGSWDQAIGVSGHTDAVTGITWAPDGEYLLSTSTDQTTRLHASWRRSSNGENGAAESWHEVARPQIHGYDLNCITALGRGRFVSGADEKLLRVFREPRAAARLRRRLAGVQEDQPDGEDEELPDAANMPVLGLSNKAVDATGDVEPALPDGQDVPSALVRPGNLDFNHPPVEDVLSRNTLWPEIEKLYGHGYEISCVAASHDGRLIASACRASSLNHAVIRLFETARWTEVRPPLTAHTLTATRLRFSHDDKYLLSVGRDRQWAVFEREAVDSTNYKLLQVEPKGHSRMILDCAWAPPTGGGRVFATAGRDKNVKIWVESEVEVEENKPFKLACTAALGHPVTAMDFLWRQSKGNHLVLAAGTETGTLFVLSLDATMNIVATVAMEPSLCLSRAVLQLAWRPQPEGAECPEKLDLAIAGEDNSLRIYQLGGL